MWLFPFESVQIDCSGLYDGWWVCIGVVVETVTVSLGWTTTDEPADVPTLTGEYTPTTFPSVDFTFTAHPRRPALSLAVRRGTKHFR
jgi:hypothetical protein